ncbi:MAG: hemolysin III family protein [Rhizobiales bacterium]|nr:hemolysin III family protein [Hyphomicrobiales bacterium]
MTMNESITAAASALGIRVPSRRELVADGIVHAVGVAAGITGSIILIAIAALRHSYVEIVAVSIYAAGMIMMFSCSALYNLARTHRYRHYFQRLDHSGIFLMIAGTYTPFTMLMLKGDWAIVLMVVVWTVAIIGVLIKLLWPKRLEGVTTGLYIGLGWVGIIALEPILTSLGIAALVLLGTGGALYCIGVIFHLWERLPYQNAIWHGFVLAGAGTHYGAVLTAVI